MSQTATITHTETVPKRLNVTKDYEIYTIDELIRQRAEELKNAPLIGFPKEGLTDYEEHSASAVDRYVNAAANAFIARGLPKVDGTLDQSPTVGLISNSGLPVIITILALNRLGYAVLLLSTRLPSNAIVRLLDLSKCKAVLATSQFSAVMAEVKKERDIAVLDALTQKEFYNVNAPTIHRTYNPHKETLKNAVIIHSSGSTGLPKPIYLTNRSCIGTFATNFNLVGFTTSPLFHSQAFYETFRCIYSGKPMYFCNYNLPLTKQNIITMISHVKPELFVCVPYILKLLADSQEGIDLLKSVSFVMYGGSACPDDLGDKLVQNGVNLNGNYGATETGRVMTTERPKGDNDWSYFRILPSVRKFVLMDQIAPGIYECVALDGLRSKSTTNSDDPPGSFRTRDLFVEHPTRPDLWKYVSRLDDRLTLVNGEKVLPIPIEGRIRHETIVQEAVVFGDGKSVPGLIVVKADEAAGLSDEEYLDKVWPAIEDANSRAESFSRIPKELVVVLPADTAYPRTDKGTFIRAQMYSKFKSYIDGAYAKFETQEEGGTLVFELPQLEEYLLERFQKHVGAELDSVDSDFFAYGIDSLQCMKMWSLLKKELDLGGRQAELGQNILYETGSVRSLARHLNGLRVGELENAKDEYQVMRDLISKYSFTPFNRKQATKPEKEVVLLTGVTGGLGAHLLSQLVRKPNVSAVWAFIRAGSDEAASQRLASSLAQRSIQLTPSELAKVQAVSSDLSKDDFGLAPARLAELRSSLTLVIHSAWAVNFNISVSSFEAQHISAVHRLISFCQSTTHDAGAARFYFCSSVSSTGGTPKPGVVAERSVPDIRHVQGTGYARSKYVAENITTNAMRDGGAFSRNLRIGQLVGDSNVGEWNTTEGIPLMIQTAVTLGALPALDEEMTWLPVDYAAGIILDVTGVNTNGERSEAGEQDPDLVYHVLNPTRFHWTRDMLPALAAAGLKFEVLPTSEWMERLRANRDPKKNPPIKLLDWFEGKYGHGAPKTPSKGPLAHETKLTAKDSETIGRVPNVTDVKYVKMMIDRLMTHWTEDAAAA
ncbi:acetyl-CoA synthetase-like protein [Aaosphaeria arxii CBS 175.79]|uniref:Acetyl-CoA synthetase-like protein n=1 Tax=Aaosphaeria arxii CBS 175.79 TaxID=1450172 RepID=A0A6A5XFL2_9PLEO|nr:acetyl-CoA synthetase-like protein [Aaosphaeria arxii CBS 175.79]KAF2011872.1 acetyl-CoA synthetase-like protein [Aaosphaeria arxii CBS 175.79]